MPTDAMKLKRIDHVRMFVGNARQSAYFYRNAFGFEVIAYGGLETGMKHEACYVLRQGQITFVLASPLSALHPEAHRLVRHGDGVQSIALEVDDVAAAFEAAVARGAQPASPPRTVEDEHGAIDLAEIHAYGDTTHTLLNRSRYRGVFAPGFQPLEPDRYSPRTFHPVGLKAIDHIVANVEEGKMGDWVDYYSKVMGFSLMASFDDKDISTEYSALMSRVVADGRGRIKFPINEPAKSRAGPRLMSSLNTTAVRACSTSRWRPATSLPACGPWPPMTSRSSGCHQPTMRCCPNGSARSGKICASWPNSVSWLIAMMRVICSRSSPSRWRIGRPSSSRSSSGAGAKLWQGELQGPVRSHRARAARRGTL